MPPLRIESLAPCYIDSQVVSLDYLLLNYMLRSQMGQSRELFVSMVILCSVVTCADTEKVLCYICSYTLWNNYIHDEGSCIYGQD